MGVKVYSIYVGVKVWYVGVKAGQARRRTPAWLALGLQTCKSAFLNFLLKEIAWKYTIK